MVQRQITNITSHYMSILKTIFVRNYTHGDDDDDDDDDKDDDVKQEGKDEG
jgi:hypothetical protein